MASAFWGWATRDWWHGDPHWQTLVIYRLRGIHPASTLPIMLDVGTNNPQHLEDPLYMGWRHPRISDEQYLEFMDMFVHAIQQRWPNVLLQFEDFAQKNATRLLNRYRHQLCCFNDDIQGTAAVTSGTLIAAAAASGRRSATSG